MLDQLREWLNGSKDYFTGVVLYAQVGEDADLKQLFEKGPTPFTTRRLQEELRAICKQLKSGHDGLYSKDAQSTTSTDTGKKKTSKKGNTNRKSTEAAKDVVKGEEPVNKDLYETCKLNADKLYKETMNSRAVLFNMAQTTDNTDPNAEERIKARTQLALDVLQNYKKISDLYEKADYVKMHGHLPDHDQEADKDLYDHLPDHLVKKELDNSRKAFNKLKKKEQTPARLVLMQTHIANIKKLEQKWQSLQFKQ